MEAFSGTYQGPATIILTNKGNKENPRVLIGGVILGDFIGNERDWQMWECDIIIMPSKKFRKNKEPGRGARIDQLLSGGYEKRENWKEEIK